MGKELFPCVSQTHFFLGNTGSILDPCSTLKKLHRVTIQCTLESTELILDHVLHGVPAPKPSWAK